MAGVNSRFASVLESEILKIQEDAVPENTKKATKFGMKVFRGKRRPNILQTSVLPFIANSRMLCTACTFSTHELRGQVNRFLTVSERNKQHFMDNLVQDI